MMIYLTRSAWGAREPRPGPGLLTVSAVEGAVIHWPGMEHPIDATGDAGMARVASALRAWQAYHMDERGWSDIAYQVAVDQAGRAWTLRGLRTQSGANGNQDLNERFGAILLVLGPDESLSAAMVSTMRGVIHDFRSLYPHGTEIHPHSAVRPGGTDCPGDRARAAISAGFFEPVPPQEDDDMPYTEAQIRAMIQAEIEEYNKRFWVEPTGTGTAIRAQLGRIENKLTGPVPADHTTLS